MERQHLSQTKNSIAPPQTQSHASDRYSPHPIEELQGAIGNQAVNQILATQPTLQTKPLFRGLSHELRSSAPIQAKLAIGAVGDRYEQEADRVAQDVVQRINAPASEMRDENEVMRKTEEGTLQREEMPEDDGEPKMKPMVNCLSVEGGIAAPLDLEASIQGARGSGQPLADSVRKPMEGEFGADFSMVRVHTDAQSDELNQSIQAKAFTTGQDVFFQQGVYEPGSRGGQELLAHELTYVVQQNGSIVHRLPHKHEKLEQPTQAKLIQRTIDIQGEGKLNVHAAMSLLSAYDEGSQLEVDILEVVRTLDKENFGCNGISDLLDEVHKRLRIKVVKQINTEVPNTTIEGYDYEIVDGEIVDDIIVILNELPKEQLDFICQDLELQRLHNLIYNTSSKIHKKYPSLIARLNQHGKNKRADLLKSQEDGKGVGREEELTWINLAPVQAKEKSLVENGGCLAYTKEQKFGLPVLKLEIEGVKRGNPCMELIHGPLELEEYNSRSYVEARFYLFQCISANLADREKKGLANALEEYNKNLTTKDLKRYELVITDLAKKFNRTKGGTQGQLNRQTNIAIPYRKFGQASKSTNNDSDFALMFDDKRSREEDLTMYLTARNIANDLDKMQITSGQTNKKDYENLISLITHVIYQEAKYIKHRISFDTPDKEDLAKHHFHVMLKLSPEDAIVSILSDKEIDALEQWVKQKPYRKLITKAIKTTVPTPSGGKDYEVSRERIDNVFKAALNARIKGGRQRLNPVDERLGKSRVYITSEEDPIELVHSHPRPTNRIAVFSQKEKDSSQKEEYYMVVEQRSSDHLLNSPTTKFKDVEKFIRDLHKN